MRTAAFNQSAAAEARVEKVRTAFSDARAHKRRLTAIGLALFVVTFFVAADIGNLDPVKIWNGLPKLHEFIVRILPKLSWDTLAHDLNEWLFPFWFWMGLLVDTILIAFLASVLGTIGAGILCFAATRTLVESTAVYFFVRRLMEVARTVPELVYALIFVFCLGPGPLAGVLAIGIHTVGALGKLFSEVNENVDHGPLDGVRAAGGGWFQMIRLGVVPQVLPNFASYALLRFEINVRASSIIGFVGAGGLGQEIGTVIAFNEYESLSALFLIILVTVSTIDVICERIRHAVIRFEEGASPA